MTAAPSTIHAEELSAEVIQWPVPAPVEVVVCRDCCEEYESDDWIEADWRCIDCTIDGEDWARADGLNEDRWVGLI